LKEELNSTGRNQDQWVEVRLTEEFYTS
jgi:hypothetical protein